MDGDTAILWLTLITAIPAAAGVWTGLRFLYLRGPGRVRAAAKEVESLGVSARLDYFDLCLRRSPVISRPLEPLSKRSIDRFDEHEQHLARTALMAKTFEGWRLHYWVDPLYIVVAMAGKDAIVVGYSVTQRSKRFKMNAYRFRPGRLGVMTFAENDGKEDEARQALTWRGAHQMIYVEHYSGANPTHYLEVILGSSGSWHESCADNLLALSKCVPEQEAWRDMNIHEEPLRSLRRTSRPNTVILYKWPLFASVALDLLPHHQTIRVVADMSEPASRLSRDLRWV